MSVLSLLMFIAVVGIAFYLWKMSKKNDTSSTKQQIATPKPYSKDELRMENVGAGGVIHLTGIGPDLEEFDLKVISKHTYRQGESTWYELECDKGSSKVWIDMEEDDELELSICLRKLKLREIGISKGDLEKFDDDEEGSFEFEGDKYWLEDSDEAVFYRHSSDKEAERFYYWDFESEKGGRFIGIERWSNGSYDVSLSEAIKPSQVSVFSLS